MSLLRDALATETVDATPATDLADATKGAGEGVYLARASLIQPEEVDWLEDGLIPLRVVTLITGLDGVGKSTILYSKAAKATRGTLKGYHYGTPVAVVVASSEDHPASVIVPRLIAAGADLDKVHIVKVRRNGLDGELSLPDDLPEVAERVGAVKARLLLVDPLISFMPLHVDSHKAQHVRSVLAPLARLAEEARLAVGAVVHFNGAASSDVRTRISGSKALRDASRSVLVCGEDPDDESRFLLVQDKNSFGPKSPNGRAYRIEGTTIEHRGQRFTTSQVVWLGEVPVTSRQMLTGSTKDDDKTGQEIAAEVILDALKGSARSWESLKELCMGAGVGSEVTARRARDDLKNAGEVTWSKVGSAWLWNLITPREPEDDEQDEKGALSRGIDPDDGQVDHSQMDEQVEQVDRGRTLCDGLSEAEGISE